jgi:hypothetical protein
VLVFNKLSSTSRCCCSCCPQIDTLSELARKKGISMRNATKQDLVSQLSRVLKKSDLSKAQLNEMNFCLTGARR